MRLIIPYFKERIQMTVNFRGNHSQLSHYVSLVDPESNDVSQVMQSMTFSIFYHLPELTSAQKRFYIESIFTGIIDGIVAYFSRSCHSGLITFVFSLFRMFDYFAIWIPSNTMKFNISMNNFIESSNVVFAYCDVSHFQHEIEEYTEY